MSTTPSSNDSLDRSASAARAARAARRVLGAAMVVSLGLTACGETKVSTSDSTTTAKTSKAADGSGGTTKTCHTDAVPKKEDAVADGADVAAIVDKRTKPTPFVPKKPVTKLGITDIIEGTGDPAAAMSSVTVHYVGVTQSDCKEFDSSWSRNEPATFSLDQVIAGWSQGLIGMKPGGRRQLVIPADQAYGDDASSGKPTGTLVFIVDMIAAKAPLEADPAMLAEAVKRGKPTVTIPSPLPTTLTKIDDVVGTGTEVVEGMSVVAHYVGVTTDGKEFDASWARNEPVTFALNQVIAGWSQGLLGMKVGGRRTLVIPADLAYGNDAQGGRPTGTLIFVIDLVGAG